MPALATFRVEGDTDAMIEAYDRASREIEQAVAEGHVAQPQAHVVCRAGDGMMVVDVWESEEQARAFLDSHAWRDALERHGIPQPRVDLFEVERAVGV